jgi:hypothetical protein
MMFQILADIVCSFLCVLVRREVWGVLVVGVLVVGVLVCWCV